jgi:pimeloyl-ACP methyl ester carboxylesterase
MTIALRNPQTISALIPVDNSPVDAALKSDFGKYVHGMRAVEDAGVTKQSDADAILQKYEEALPIRQFLLTNLIRSPDTNALRFRIPINTLASTLNHMADFPFRDPDEARYEGPTLFVRGTKSHYVADEALPLIGRFFPQFELLDIQSGHWVISEKPDEFRRGVVDFLQRRVAD